MAPINKMDFANDVGLRGVLASESGQFDLGAGWTIGAQIDGFFGDDFQDVSGSAILG